MKEKKCKARDADEKLTTEMAELAWMLVLRACTEIM